MSSRNVYLGPEQRKAAPVLHRALEEAASAYDDGERSPERLREAAMKLLDSEPLAEVDYVSVADAVTLREQEIPSDNPLLLSMTVRIGKPRLLDNCLLPYSLNTREGATRVLGGA